MTDLDAMIMWNRLQAVADEQAGALMRTAFSPIVRESGDLSAGVFDARGRMLAQAVTGTPGHVNTMAAAVAGFFDYFPPASMRPGDVYLTNDPWLGSGHLNDFVLVQPCFFGGDGGGDGDGDTLIGFLSCTSHLVDIGGQCMGPDGTDVYDEGLYIPPIRLLNGGQMDATLIALLRANSRIPEESEGDVYALVACCEVGVRRMREMMTDFGIRDLGALADTILKASEQATRARIAALPDGVYENEMLTDGHEFEVRLRGVLSIKGEQIHLDLAGSSGPSRHGINVPLNFARAYATFGIKCAVAPDIPNNAGALAPIEVSAPPNSIVNAQKPAPVCSRHIIGQLLPDLALGCLHRACPDRTPAEGASTLWDLPMRNALGGGAPFSVELVHNGGTGARPLADGLSATGYPSGVMGSLVEITENVAPLHIVRRELRTDSGGAGRSRGGLGQVIELAAVAPAPIVLFGTVDRIKHPARGRDGGGDGANGELSLASGVRLNGKGRQEIPAGDTLVVRTPGGGGYGDPLRREPQAVAADVADDLVTVAAAKRKYGVVLNADGTPDAVRTTRSRAKLASALASALSITSPPAAVAVVDNTPARPTGGTSRGLGRIGVVVPVSNSNLEADMALLRPPGVSMHFMRVGGYDLDAIPDGAQMRQLALTALSDTVDGLCACRVDVILYGCTSATLANGPDFDRSMRAQIEARAGVPAATAAGALVEALRDLGVTRVGYASPYVRSLNQEAVAYLTQCGLQVVSVSQVDADLGNYGQGELTPDQVFDLGLRADHADAEAVVLSCTDMRAVEAIDALESALGKPVVTSNQALLHAAVKRLKRPVTPPLGFGRLLSGAPASEESARAQPTPRPSIRTLAPYAIATAPPAGAIRLNQNECATPPSATVAAAHRAAVREVNRYPDGACTALRAALAEAHGLNAEGIVCGNGSAELLALLACAYTGPGDEILSGAFAYLYFDTAAHIAGATPVRASGPGLEFDVALMLAAVTPRTRMVCVDNPNNPTGALLARDAVAALREGLRDDILLVLDAAYAEYVTDADYEPGGALVEAGGNTVMLRTFSKIYGLAGARVGWAYCPAAVASVLNRVRLPNNVTGPSQAAALAALAETRVADIRAHNDGLRRRFCARLNALGLVAYPSQGSYVLVRFADTKAAQTARATLERRRIYARPMTAYGLADCIRFTIGDGEEMDAAVAALALDIDTSVDTSARET